MRLAQRLRQELDLWGVVWQQVETFVDRISGAADQDASGRRKVEALLTVAGVVERARRPTDAKALGAPVLRTLPTAKEDRDGNRESVTDPWAPAERVTRLPGLDDLELAAAPVSAVDASGEPIDGDLTKVNLFPPRSVPAAVDPRAGTVTLGVMPSYDPGSATPSSAFVPALPGSIGLLVDVAEDGDVAGLFSVDRRRRATMGEQPDVEHVRTWGEVAAARRAGVGPGTKVPVDPPCAAGRAASLAAQAIAVVEGLRAGTLSTGTAAAALSALLADPVAAGVDTGDADALTAAAQTLDDEGTDDEDLPTAVREVAAALRATPAAQSAMVSAITQLAGAPGSTVLQDRVLELAGALGLTATAARLLTVRVEDGPLRAELDNAVAARLHYPDGSLRMLRTLESAFAWRWPAQVHWFTTRRDLVLSPLLARFRAPFHTSVRALVSGGDTGLLALGLSVGPSLAVGATQVVTGQPASLLDSVSDIEPGQVGLVAGDRPAALTVLGLDTSGGRLALHVAPLRVSTAPGAPGVAGLLAGDVEIGVSSAGLSIAELQSGESDAGPAADGVVGEALALWSQCAAVFGRAGVEAAAAAVPDPPGGPLEGLSLHGAVPARATTLVLTDLPAARWDRTDPHDPVPRLCRPGEVLLLRGMATPEDGGPDVLVQGVVEVETVFRTTGSMLAAMDLSAAGRLSTAELDTLDDRPVFRCGPEDDVAVVTLRRSTVDVQLSEPISLRRDFAGFDPMSLAARRLLPPELFGAAPAGPAGVDRSREFAFALDTVTGWLRYSQHG